MEEFSKVLVPCTIERGGFGNERTYRVRLAVCASDEARPLGGGDEKTVRRREWGEETRRAKEGWKELGRKQVRRNRIQLGGKIATKSNPRKSREFRR